MSRRDSTAFLPGLLALMLLGCVGSAAAFGSPGAEVAPPNREAGANTAELWLGTRLPDSLEEAGLKVGGNVEVFLSFAVHLHDQLTQGRPLPGVAGELGATALALWFLTGGADQQPVFHLPPPPGIPGGEAVFLSPVDAFRLQQELKSEPLARTDEGRAYLRSLGNRLSFVTDHADLSWLNWLAPLSPSDLRWSNLLQGGDQMAVDAAMADFDALRGAAPPEVLGAADVAYSQLQDQAALHGLARELSGAARTGDAGLTEATLVAFLERLTQANEWRAGYPDDNFRKTYATYHRLPLLNWSHYAYGLAALFFAAALILRRPRISWLGVGAVGLGFVGHSIFLALRWILSGHSPTSNMYEFLVLLSWCVVGVYLFFTLRRESHYTGLAAMAVVFGIWALSGLFPSRIVQQLMPALQSPWMTIHVGLTALAEGFMALGFIFALHHLFKSLGRRPERAGLLPSSAALEELTYRSLLLSFPFYTLGALVAGMIWAEQAWGSWWSWDPKEVLSLFVWLALILYLHARRVKPWRDRRLALLALLPFILAMLNLFSNLIIRGLHSYA